MEAAIHPSEAETSKVSNALMLLLKIACYAALTYLAHYYITDVLAPYPYTTIYDSLGYMKMAAAITQNGLFAFDNTLRTYGYPALISISSQIIQRLWPGQNWVYIFVQFQFAFHVGAALLATLIMDRLGSQRPSALLKILCFGLILFCPTLLGLTRDILADSITVFWVMLFLWSLITPFRGRYFIASSAIAVAIILRPFNQPWAACLIALLMVLNSVRYLAAKYPDTSIAQTPLHIASELLLLNRRRTLSIGLQILMPLLVIVGLQYYLSLRDGTGFALIGKEGLYWQQRVIYDSAYVFKYETFANGRGQLENLIYKSFEREKLIAQPTIQDPIRVALADPLGTIPFMLVKTTGMFQSYTWSSYRINMDHSMNEVFFTGLALLTSFIYLTLLQLNAFVTRLRTATAGQPLMVLQNVERERSNGATLRVRLNLVFNFDKRLFLNSEPISNTLILWLAATLYIVLYAAVSSPEPRYLAPILPILISSGLYAVVYQKHRSSLLLAAFIAFTLYMLTYQTLQLSLTHS